MSQNNDINADISSRMLNIEGIRGSPINMADMNLILSDTTYNIDESNTNVVSIHPPSWTLFHLVHWASQGLF